jgi:CRP/FNR family cyclic AMP-dependent transcriptional regulator
MPQHSLEPDRFKEDMGNVLLAETRNSSVLTIPKHDTVYAAGDEAGSVFFIQTGQVKLIMLSSEGKECMLAIHAARDIFGEMCLADAGTRQETATAMEDTRLKEIPAGRFLELLGKHALLEGFVRYMAVRVADQQQVIANLVTVDSEQRLGKTLLHLAAQLGKREPDSVLIELRISHEELATMVGTTRPRISMFMQRFRNLGLVDLSQEHYMIVKEKKLAAYLESIA